MSACGTVPVVHVDIAVGRCFCFVVPGRPHACVRAALVNFVVFVFSVTVYQFSLSLMHLDDAEYQGRMCCLFTHACIVLSALLLLGGGAAGLNVMTIDARVHMYMAAIVLMVIFVVARYCYSMCYVHGLQPFRTIFFAIGAFTVVCDI